MLNDMEYMQLAVELAKKGEGWVNPNPMVGAVVVKNGKIIGKGHHEKFGGLHAERNALADCKEDVKGATIYVTLEPCCHYGKTPPCTEALIESGVKRVVVGALDPNPVVAGKGVEMLRKNNITVDVGVLKDECECLIKIFSHFMKNEKPYVVMKYAMTIDGKIATYKNESKWITGEEARHNVHKTRHALSAIMVGVGTVISDDPVLTCRLENSKNPLRVVCDTNLRTPINSKIVSTAKYVPTVIATCVKDQLRHEAYVKHGCNVIDVEMSDGHVDLCELMEKLGEMSIDSILLEGGGTLNWSALKSGIVNSVQAYIAPKIFGGALAKSPVGGIGVEMPNMAAVLSKPKLTWLDEDILLESEVIADVHRNS